ncbi:hypothetical protein ABZT47_30750 [Sphaerisporangium sp. NPDC005289]|uniref:hypothetical protein n=1 Tax=Sphaerisporangium sp. NPDC005289 TaxID=3155247 RepID=UPI0033B0CAF6
MPNGVGGNYGTKAVPAYVTADAPTAPLPKITVEEPPPPPPPAKRRSPIARLGDLPMRVIYRGLAGVVAAVAVVAAVVAFSVTDLGKGAPTAAGPAPAGPPSTLPVQGTGAAPPSGAPATSQAPLEGTSVSAAAPASGSAADPGVSAAPGASASPGVAATAGTSASPGVTTEPAGAGSTPVATPQPGKSALADAEADPRVPALPANRRLANYPGHGAPAKGRVKDNRSGISFTRFVKQWKLTKSSPFATRRVLPAVKGAGHRGLLATCPVPIAVQDELKDTAFLAARWTLNYHPDGSKITWTASQGFKAGKREGWLLGYRVTYKAGGKKHVATAAVALVDVPAAKPAMVFITIPDAQKKRWADINTLISSIRPL